MGWSLKTKSMREKDQRAHEIAMLDKQYEQNVALWNMQNAYNLPSAQIQRLKDAGINPQFFNGDSGNAGSSPSPIDYSSQRAPYSTSEAEFAMAADEFSKIYTVLNQRSESLRRKQNDDIRNAVLLQNAQENARYHSGMLDYNMAALAERTRQNAVAALQNDRRLDLMTEQFRLSQELASSKIKMDDAQRMRVANQIALDGKRLEQMCVDIANARERLHAARRNNASADTLEHLETEVRQKELQLENARKEDEKFYYEHGGSVVEIASQYFGGIISNILPFKSLLK